MYSKLELYFVLSVKRDSPYFKIGNNTGTKSVSHFACLHDHYNGTFQLHKFKVYPHVNISLFFMETPSTLLFQKYSQNKYGSLILSSVSFNYPQTGQSYNTLRKSIFEQFIF